MTPDHPTINLRTLVDNHIKCIHETIKKGCKDFCPTLLIQVYDPETKEEENHVAILAVDMNDHDEKRKALEGFGRDYYNKKKAPMGVALATEAWVSKQLHTMPRLADDRREVLIIQALGIDGSKLFELMSINRDKKGNIIQAPFVSNDDMKPELFLLNHFYIGFFTPIMEKEGRI